MQEQPADNPGGEIASTTRWLAALSYVFVLALIPFLLRPRHPFIRFHARQGVVLFLADIVALFGIWVLDFTLGRIPFLGILLSIGARIVFGLPLLALVVLGVTRSLAGEKGELPWIGHLADELPEPHGGGRGGADSGFEG